MKKFLCVLCFIPVILFLSSCELMTKENLPAPAALTKFQPTLQVDPSWSVQVGSGASKYYYRMSPAIDNNRIFAVDYNGRVSAVNINNGKVLWKIRVAKNITTGASADKDRVFVVTGDGELVAISQQKGEILWKAPVSGETLATPTAFDHIVLIKGTDGSLTALSQEDGRQLWHYTQKVPSLVLHASSRPIISAGYVIAGFANGRVAKLYRGTGNPIWVRQVAMPQGATDIERMVDIDVTPVVMGNRVYVATYQGKIIALNRTNGQIIWQHKLSSYTGIVADDERVYVSDANSYVWAFNDENGAVMWQQKKLFARAITGPVLFENYVVVADVQGYLHFMSKQDGHFVSRIKLDKSGVITDPVVKNNKLYVYSRSGVLYCFKKHHARMKLPLQSIQPIVKVKKPVKVKKVKKQKLVVAHHGGYTYDFRDKK